MCVNEAISVSPMPNFFLINLHWMLFYVHELWRGNSLFFFFLFFRPRAGSIRPNQSVSSVVRWSQWGRGGSDEKRNISQLIPTCRFRTNKINKYPCLISDTWSQSQSVQTCTKLPSFCECLQSCMVSEPATFYKQLYLLPHLQLPCIYAVLILV